MKSIEFSGATFRVVDEGAGPPLVLLHGFPLDHTMWRHQVAFFAARHRVIVPDLRGFGGSGGQRDVVRMEDFADDVAGLLDELEVTEPVTLAGLSMGGYIAFQFWHRHAARLQRLILCDTRSVADQPEVARGRQQMAERVLVEGPRLVADAMLGRLIYDALPASHRLLVDELRGVIERTDRRAIAAAQRGMALRPDVTSWLSQIQVPTLVVCGERDLISPLGEMQTLAAAIPGSCWAPIADAGHLAPLEQPEAVNRVLDDFLCG